MSRFKKISITYKVEKKGGLFGSATTCETETIEITPKILARMNAFLTICESSEQFAAKKNLLLDLLDTAFDAAGHYKAQCFVEYTAQSK